MKFAPFFIVLICLFSIMGVFAQDDPADSSENSATKDLGQEQNQEQNLEQNTKENQESAIEEFGVNPGITPDSPFYVIDDLIEKMTIGNNPENAMDYREEKIAEAIKMVEESKTEQVEKVLERALEYGNVLEKQISPEMKEKFDEESDKIKNVLEELKKKAPEESRLNEKFEENIEKQKKIDKASEIVSKINELCDALSKLNPLQYADTCKSGSDSPQWMKEKDREMTKEQKGQAKVFFEKLSQCFENPAECDCTGMGVQSFEDFCIEKSKSAAACMNGDEASCEKMEEGDPTDLLPDYLIPVFKKIESKYSGAEMQLHMPKECADAGAKTPKECNKIMFSLYSPQECVDAGLKGETKEDEIKCKRLMFKQKTPQECVDAGISMDDPDAPRKCSKIMFQMNAPQECVDAGLTGESREDQKKCNEIVSQKMPQGMGVERASTMARFNRDCNAISDLNEKMKCFEEFYNNANANLKEGFIPAETQQACQPQEQIEKLVLDCKSRGQEGIVENRNGCSWVICSGGTYRGEYGGNTITTEQRTAGGMKCPDSICDDYERMNPYACPQDCGGQTSQQTTQGYPESECKDGCSQECPGASRTDCIDNGMKCACYYEQMQPIEQQPQQEPIAQQPQEPVYVEPAPSTETVPSTEPAPPAESSGSSGGESIPVTGAVIGGNEFLNYWWD